MKYKSLNGNKNCFEFCLENRIILEYNSFSDPNKSQKTPPIASFAIILIQFN